jgi:hypothetical protein
VPKPESELVEVWEPGGTGFNETGNAYSRIPYLHITLGTAKNATFSLRKASEAFIFHWQSDLRVPEGLAEPHAASHPKAQACRSISQIAVPPDGQTFQSQG